MRRVSYCSAEGGRELTFHARYDRGRVALLPNAFVTDGGGSSTIATELGTTL